MKARQHPLFSLLCLLIASQCLYLAACKSGPVPANDSPLFETVPVSVSGLDFRNDVDDKSEITIYDNIYVYNGGGVATGDLDNDGLPDLLLVSNQGQSKVYRNLGDFKFEDITAKSGIDDRGGWTTGVTFADVNADGWLDIYLCKSGYHATENRNNLLYLNQQDGTFSEQAGHWGLNSPATSTHASFFDYDLDGDLDCYLVNHPGNFDLIMDFYYYVYDPKVDTLNMNRLFENTGESFRDVTLEAGLGYEKGFGLSVRIADANMDGFPDIFVANDFLTPDYLFLNNGDKTFREGRQESLDKVSLFSMGSDFGDINNDALPDFMVVDMEPGDHLRRKCNDLTFPIGFYDQQQEFFGARQFSRNMLHLGRADGTFSEVGEWAGVAKTDWSWNVLLEDLDQDGWQDIFVTNGTKRELNERDYMSLAFGEETIGASRTKHNADELIDSLPVTLLPNEAFRNLGTGQFEPIGKKWGLDQALTSSGAAYADFDLDGDLDLVVNNSDTLASLFRNTSNSTVNRYLKVRFRGPEGNSFGLGTKVFLRCGEQTFYRELSNSRGFQSSSVPVLHFGLGPIAEIDELKVLWPDGRSQVLRKLTPNQELLLSIEDASPEKPQSPKSEELFSEGEALDFLHQEGKFNDFKRDKIIPQKLSAEGPCLATADVNGDGFPDVFTGGAAGQSGQLFLGSASGDFREVPGPWQENPASEDLGACFFDANGDQHPDLYLAHGSNEFYPGAPELKDALYLNDGAGNFSHAPNALPEPGAASCSPVAADFDQDGDMDLFVAGRLIPGAYGKPGESRLLRNDSGTFTEVTDEIAPGLSEAGMLTSAHWADLNQDEKPDLIVLGQWMAPQIWMNEGGVLKLTNANGLKGLGGWWSALLVEDLDGDGDLDFAAGNFGTNSIFKASKTEPLELWAGDFDGSGSWDPVVLHYLRGEQGVFVDRDLFCKSMPDFFNDFHTYRSFAETAPQQIFGPEKLGEALQLNCTEMRSGWFKNDGKGNFEFQAFPALAQVAPIRVILTGDFDRDGRKDLFLAGNSAAHFYDLGPIMASRGQLLLGTEQGFALAEPLRSGLKLRGEIAAGTWIEDSHQRKILLAPNGGRPFFLTINSPPQ